MLDKSHQVSDSSPERRVSREQDSLHVAIIGAGFGGLGMAIQLKKAGITSFQIFERARELGGCWRDNTYPGLCCDIPSHFYSYSFELNPNWSRKFAPGREIWEYLQHCKRKYGLDGFIAYDSEVTGAVYNQGSGNWLLTLASGRSIRAKFVVCAQGTLAPPNLPDIPGLESFKGPVIHTARWDSSVELRDLRVGIIGNAASGVQVTPKLAEIVSRLSVFQRTPNWIFPRFDSAISRMRRTIYRIIPGAMRLARLRIFLEHEIRYFALADSHGWMAKFVRWIAMFYLDRSVKDPELRKKLTPDYQFGCKRMLISDDFFAALQLPHVSLVTDPIIRIVPSGVVVRDDKLVPLDALVLATGFRVRDPITFPVIGRHGQALRDVWNGVPEAHLGVSVTGFPNFFLVGGPNSAHGHTSFIYVMENHFKYILRCVQHADQARLRSLEVRADVQTAYNEGMQARLRKSVWAGQCRNWYQAGNGRVFTQVPGFAFEYASKLKRPHWEDFCVEREPSALSASINRDASASPR